MNSLDINKLVDLLRECAGVDESADLSGDINDNTFEELGYDSLALLNTAGVIERNYGIVLADDVVAKAKTPRELIDIVNDAIAAAI